MTYDPIKKSCIVSHPTKKIYYTLVTIALFFVPITVMSTAYICVVWKLWANVLPGEPNIINMNHQDQARKKVHSKKTLRTVRLTQKLTHKSLSFFASLPPQPIFTSASAPWMFLKAYECQIVSSLESHPDSFANWWIFVPFCFDPLVLLLIILFK